MATAYHYYAFGLLTDTPPARGLPVARAAAITSTGEGAILCLPTGVPIETLRERFYGRMVELSPRNPDGTLVAPGLVAVWEGEGENPRARGLIERINGEAPAGLAGTVAIIRHRDGRTVDHEDADLLHLDALADGYTPARAR